MLLLKGNYIHVDLSRIPISTFVLLIFRTINTYCVMSKRLHQLWYVEQNNISRVVTQHSDSILSCDLMRWELAREVRQSINWRHWSPGQHVHQLKGQRNVHLVLKYNSTLPLQNIIHQGGHHSNQCTSIISNLSCNPLLKHSAATNFENRVQDLADGDVSKGHLVSKNVYPGA